jgi:hypothetical protein
VLTPVGSPAVTSIPVSYSFTLDHFFAVPSDQESMVGSLLTVWSVKDTTTIRKKARVGSIDTNSDRSNVAKNKFHMILVVGTDDTPRFDRSDGLLYLVVTAGVFETNIRIFCRSRKSVAMNEVKGK